MGRDISQEFTPQPLTTVGFWNGIPPNSVSFWEGVYEELDEMEGAGSRLLDARCYPVIQHDRPAFALLRRDGNGLEYWVVCFMIH